MQYGRKDTSGYEYNWNYTEIFNEIEYEHHLPVELYTRAYGAVIQGIRGHTNNYDMKYVGFSFARRLFLSKSFLIKMSPVSEHNQFAAVRYFLNHSNHAPDIPLDMISYHFHADSKTRTTIGELGVILGDDSTPGAPQFPLIYWNAAAALYAYSWVINNDQAVISQTTDVGGQNVSCQAFIGKNGRRWVLIINKRYANVDVSLPGCTGGQMQIINEASGIGPATVVTLTANNITLSP